MHRNLLLGSLAAFLNEVESRKKAANQVNNKLWCINYKKIVYSIMMHHTCFVCWSSTQPCWYIFSSWPHNDFTLLSHSVTRAHLFLHQRCFWNRISNLFWDSASHKNTCMPFVGINWLFRRIQGSLYRQVVFLYRFPSRQVSEERFRNSLLKLSGQCAASTNLRVMI